MKFDLGNIIYIIFIAIGLLTTFLKKKKKTQPQTKSNPVDIILEELLGKKTEPEKRRVVPTYEPVSSPTYDFDEPENESLKYSKESVKDLMERHKGRMNKKGSYGADEELDDSDSEFDARQAIIHYEILKRPDY